MKFLGHESIAHTDHRLKDIISKYGMFGYGVYWYLNERICHELELPKGIDCVLVDNLERLAKECQTTLEKLTEMLDYFVLVGAFQKTSEGKYQNLKILTRLDRYGKKKLQSKGIHIDYENISSEEIYQKLKELYGLGTQGGPKVAPRCAQGGHRVARISAKRKETKLKETKQNSLSNFKNLKSNDFANKEKGKHQNLSNNGKNSKIGRLGASDSEILHGV
jgi:hypothetical protein